MRNGKGLSLTRLLKSKRSRMRDKTGKVSWDKIVGPAMFVCI